MRARTGDSQRTVGMGRHLLQSAVPSTPDVETGGTFNYPEELQRRFGSGREGTAAAGVVGAKPLPFLQHINSTGKLF